MNKIIYCHETVHRCCDSCHEDWQNEYDEPLHNLVNDIVSIGCCGFKEYVEENYDLCIKIINNREDTTKESGIALTD